MYGCAFVIVTRMSGQGLADWVNGEQEKNKSSINKPIVVNGTLVRIPKSFGMNSVTWTKNGFECIIPELSLSSRIQEIGLEAPQYPVSN